MAPVDYGLTGARPLDPGDLVGGRYRIERRIGSGAFGIVYRVLDSKTGHIRALKTLRPFARAPASVTREFADAAALLLRLRHPNIVQAFDWQGAPEFYLVMEHLEGETLAAALSRGARQGLGALRAVRIACDMLAGLDEMHAQGMVCVDLKPDNIFLARLNCGPELVKLIDFGLACPAERPSLWSWLRRRQRLRMPPPAYLSPEEAQGGAVTARTDIYKTGLLLHEMLSGRPPFLGPGTGAIIRQHRRTEPPRLRLTGRGAEVLELVASKALAKDPAARHATAADFGAALRGWLATSGGDAASQRDGGGSAGKG